MWELQWQHYKFAQGSYTCSSESALVKMSHGWKSHVAAQLCTCKWEFRLVLYVGYSLVSSCQGVIQCHTWARTCDFQQCGILTSVDSDEHAQLPFNWFKPSSEIFLLTVPRQCFFCWSFVLFMSCVFHAFPSVRCCLVVTCWEGSCLRYFVVFLSVLDVLSWVRCGTWLYQFLIFVAFLTYTLQMRFDQ